MSEHMTPSEHSEHTAGEQPVFGMKRAAEIAGISVSTIRRNKSRLEECGAVISPDGWKVPISALVASGLMKPTTPVPDYPEPEKGSQNGAQSHSEVRELERQVMELRHRAELAEERQRAAEEKLLATRELTDALKESLAVERRMLTAPKDVSQIGEPPRQETLKSAETPIDNSPPGPRALPWWKRILH